MAEKQAFDRGIKRTVKIDGQNFYLFISPSGKHEVTIPFENRPENKQKRWEINELMRNISEIHGYFEQEE